MTSMPTSFYFSRPDQVPIPETALFPLFPAKEITVSFSLHVSKGGGARQEERD